MKNITVIIWGLLSFTNLYAANDDVPYISPGIEISWNLNGEFIFRPKLSFGIFDNGNFYNITIGYASSKNGKVYPYYFLEGQFGKLSEPMKFRKLQLFNGFGLGIGIHTNSNDAISYKASLFTGYGLFANASFLLYKEKLYPDLGLEAVLPIPIGFDGFGSKDWH